MIDNLLNLMFRCAHRHLTSPFTPVGRKGEPHASTYVVCLDCAKQFEYDLTSMRVGKPIDHSHDACVVPKNMPSRRTGKMKYTALAAVPVAIAVGAMLKRKRSDTTKEAGSGDARRSRSSAAPVEGNPGEK